MDDLSLGTLVCLALFAGVGLSNAAAHPACPTPARIFAGAVMALALIALGVWLYEISHRS
jgi:hypothetical protein